MWIIFEDRIEVLFVHALTMHISWHKLIWK